MVTLKDPGFNSANQDGAGDGTTTVYSTPSSPPQRNSTFAGDNKSYYTTTDDAYDPTNVGQPRKGYSDYGGGEATSYYAERAPDGYTLAGQKNGYDDDGLTHRSNPAPLDDSPVTPLVRNMGQKQYQDLEYAEPYKDPNQPPPQAPKGLASFFANAKYPLQQRIEDKKRGIGRQRTPFVVYATTAAMVAIFIYELVLNSREQGSPISTKPVINPMLGPSSSALVNLGARFPPCMKFVEQVPPSTPLACMNNTANPIDQICPVSELCGFGGIDVAKPNQWFRFVTAIFLHAGIVHIVINMLAQLSLSAQIEREMGSGGFIITYFAAGIFGNVLGGNFSLVGVPSVGASGAIFGTVAVTWVDLVAHWKYHYRPVRKLVFMTIELLIGIAIGYIPYVDNFAHIGGFVMGLLVGTVFYPIISETKRHKTIAWVFKLAALPIAIILFVVLVRNFYTSDPYAACSGCRYLSCFPTASNNHCKGTGLTTSSGNAF